MMQKTDEKKCPHCGKTFAQHSTLVAHIRTHTNEKPFQCLICGESFAQSSTLEHHSLVHNDEKPFQCEECKKQFKRQDYLDNHMRTHTNEKPFHCDECPKRFPNKSNLNRHKRIHTKMKPFECVECFMRFARQDHLNCHVKKVHPTKPTNVEHTQYNDAFIAIQQKQRRKQDLAELRQCVIRIHQKYRMIRAKQIKLKRIQSKQIALNILANLSIPIVISTSQTQQAHIDLPPASTPPPPLTFTKTIESLVKQAKLIDNLFECPKCRSMYYDDRNLLEIHLRWNCEENVNGEIEPHFEHSIHN